MSVPPHQQNPYGQGQSPYGQQPYGQPGQTPYPQQQGGFSGQPYQPQQYPYAAGYPGYAGPVSNTKATWALVSSLIGLLCGIGSILGVVLGFIARSEIKASNGTQTGEGKALAGIIIGSACIILQVLWAFLVLGIGTTTS